MMMFDINNEDNDSDRLPKPQDWSVTQHTEETPYMVL